MRRAAVVVPLLWFKELRRHIYRIHPLLKKKG